MPGKRDDALVVPVDAVVRIAETARSATSAWRAVCAKGRRRLDPKIAVALSELDLDEDVLAMTNDVRDAARAAPGDVDTLRFGLFDAIDDGSGRRGGLYVAGVASQGRTALELVHDPWGLDRRFLASAALDAIFASSSGLRRSQRSRIEYAFGFAAVVVMSRFATAGLGYRVIVGVDDEEERSASLGLPPAVEIELSAPRTEAPLPFASAVPRLLEPAR